MLILGKKLIRPANLRKINQLNLISFLEISRSFSPDVTCF